MRKPKYLLCLFAVVIFSMTVYAHPGNTDKYGGHHDYNNVSGLGSYHYHHGYAPHLHTNGICPYDYDDKTGINSGSSSGSSSSYYYPDPEPVEPQTYSAYGHYAVHVSSGRVHLPDCPKINGYIKKTTLDAVKVSIKPCKYCQPLHYSSIEDVPEYKKEHFHKFLLRFLKFAGVGLIIYWIVVFVWSRIDKRKEIKQELEEKRKIEEKEDLEYAYYFSLYAFYRPELFCDVPKGCFIKNNLPASNGRGKYGRFTVYFTQKGKCYHQKATCINSNSIYQTNVFAAQGFYRPCSRCCSQVPIDFKWYVEWKRIADIKERYNIP